jgi:8-oxo-dGTP pyrophosphatase MutT (NUDIX family)
LEKVTVFVTRGPSEARELLVFRHPSGGIQLPAGTVEEGEPAEEAALRETWEETGLTAVEVAAYLGVQPQTMRADYQMVLRKVTLLQHPHRAAPEVEPPFSTYLGLRRGLPVRRIGSAQAGYVNVAYEEFDAIAIAGDNFEIPARSVSGWVPSDAVTPVLVRHFFHLTVTEPTPHTWVQSAEEWEHRFELYWVPLPSGCDDVPCTGLIPSQAVWLTEYVDRLASDEKTS